MGNTSSGHMNIKYFGVLITNDIKMMICVDNCAVCTPKETYYGENLRDVQMTLNGNSLDLIVQTYIVHCCGVVTKGPLLVESRLLTTKVLGCYYRFKRGKFIMTISVLMSILFKLLICLQFSTKATDQLKQ